jgi:hypothetical protein
MSSGNTEHPLPHRPAEAVAAVREDARFGAAFLRRHGLRLLLFFVGVLLPRGRTLLVFHGRRPWQPGKDAAP